MNRFNDIGSQALYEDILTKLKGQEFSPESIAYCIVYAIDKTLHKITDNLPIELM